jgi:hypothetical protein
MRLLESIGKNVENLRFETDCLDMRAKVQTMKERIGILDFVKI